MAKKVLITISTKTGDGGETGLANGERLSKGHAVFAVIGELDELNSWLGVIAAHLDDRFAHHREFVYQVQDTLFYIGAELARSPKAKLKASSLRELEGEATALQESMAEGWHTQFLLPGGTQLGGFLDVARSVCRRAERALVAYGTSHEVAPLLLQYVNRLSDYIYLLRCSVNLAGAYTERRFSPK